MRYFDWSQNKIARHYTTKNLRRRVSDCAQDELQFGIMSRLIFKKIYEQNCGFVHTNASLESKNVLLKQDHHPLTPMLPTRTLTLTLISMLTLTTSLALNPTEHT